MKRNKRWNQLIAVNLKEKMKEIEQDPPPIPGFRMSRLVYLIHLIISHKQHHHIGSYSVLNMEYMTKVVPGARHYLQFLKREGVVEWIDYSKGRNSRMYRLNEESKTEYRTITDMNLIRRIEQSHTTLLQRNSKKYPRLNQYIHQVEMDTEGALKTVEEKYAKNLFIGRDNAEGRRTYSLAALSKIEAGEIYIKVNKTNGRLDSNYTALPKELLQHLSIDSKPLVELDIRNSQPFFAAALLRPTTEMEKLMKRFLGDSLYMSIKALEVSDCSDVKLYRSLVADGGISIYHYIWIHARRHGIEFKTRPELKKQVFVVFFGKRHAYKYNPTARLFKRLFPNVQKVFDLIKRDHHNKLAIFLQRVESYTMLERVANRISAEFPDIPFVTRHDSLLPALGSTIMVSDERIDEVIKVIKDTIKEVTGLIPKIKRKS